ncbi:MAG: PilZ domain-containing protein [Sulfuriflexus sp.]|nr:PilZ domain-containing protein [Sulfuriflexus sp.]
MNQSTTEQEHRKHHRVLFDTVASIHINADNMNASMIDISLKGALIKKPDSWMAKVGDTGQLRIVLSDNISTINMDVKVAHIEDDHVGFHCEHIDIDSITHLRRLVELNLGDPEMLEREFSALQA